MARFIHPVHSRGLRSSGFGSPLTNLTNKKIDNYVLAGKYGKDKQEKMKRALEQKKKKNPKAKVKTEVKLSDFKHVL